MDEQKTCILVIKVRWIFIRMTVKEDDLQGGEVKAIAGKGKCVLFTI